MANPLESMLLSNLRKKSPQLYDIYMETRRTGRDPFDVMTDMYSEGRISDRDLQNVSDQMRRFGKPIPEEAMQRIKGRKRKTEEPSQQKPKGNGFRGLF